VQTEIELWQQADDVQTCHISSPSGRVQIDPSSCDTKGVLRRHFKTPKIVLPTSFLCFIRRMFCYKSNGVDRTPLFMSCKYVMEGDLHY